MNDLLWYKVQMIVSEPGFAGLFPTDSTFESLGVFRTSGAELGKISNGRGPHFQPHSTGGAIRTLFGKDLHIPTRPGITFGGGEKAMDSHGPYNICIMMRQKRNKS